MEKVWLSEWLSWWIITLDDIASICEELIENFEQEVEHSDIIKKYQRIFNEKVIGQEQAKEVMYNILEQIHANMILREEWYNKPIASILFAWPSWVGKTKIARIMQKALNEFFNEDNELIKINCADYQWEQPFSLTRLIWASAWYIWSDKKPKLHPDNIKWKWRIILFDEIEKAWTPLKNLLLSILDDGILEVNYTEQKNPEVNLFNYNQQVPIQEWNEYSYIKSYFRDSVIILTSNIWIWKLDEEVNWKKIWFWQRKWGTKEANQVSNDIILKELSNHFKIELQWRFSDIVPFSFFEKEETKQLIDSHINSIQSHVIKEHWIITVFSEKLRHKILEEIFNSENFKKYWARYIEKYFKDNFLSEISKIINWKKVKEQDILFISIKDNKITFSSIPQSKIKN